MCLRFNYFKDLRKVNFCFDDCICKGCLLYCCLFLLSDIWCNEYLYWGNFKYIYFDVKKKYYII